MNAGENDQKTTTGGEPDSATPVAPDTAAPPPENTARPEEAAAAASPAPRRPRGFAAMDREKVREIARLGGKAAHQAGTAHEFTSEEARTAGRNGGLATHAKRRAKNAEVAAKE